MHGHSITSAGARSSAQGYPVKKDTELNLSTPLGSFQLPLRPTQRVRGWCCLICCVDCWQLYSSMAEEAEDRRVPWFGGFPVRMSNCSTSIHPSSPRAASAPLPSRPCPISPGCHLPDWAGTTLFIPVLGWHSHQLPLPMFYLLWHHRDISRSDVRSWRLPAPELVH